MQGSITRLTEQETNLVSALDLKISAIQAKLDELEVSETAAVEVVRAIQAKKLILKKEISPVGEMKAGVASPHSRDKYFGIDQEAMLAKVVLFLNG